MTYDRRGGEPIAPAHDRRHNDRQILAQVPTSPSCGQYEDMPPTVRMSPDGRSGLTDLPVGLAVTVTPSVR